MTVNSVRCVGGNDAVVILWWGPATNWSLHMRIGSGSRPHRYRSERPSPAQGWNSVDQSIWFLPCM